MKEKYSPCLQRRWQCCRSLPSQASCIIQDLLWGWLWCSSKEAPSGLEGWDVTSTGAEQGEPQVLLWKTLNIQSAVGCCWWLFLMATELSAAFISLSPHAHLEQGWYLPPHFSGLFGDIINLSIHQVPVTEAISAKKMPRRKPITPMGLEVGLEGPLEPWDYGKRECRRLQDVSLLQSMDNDCDLNGKRMVCPENWKRCFGNLPS